MSDDMDRIYIRQLGNENDRLEADNARLRAVLAKIASPMDCDKVNGKCRSMRLAQEAVDGTTEGVTK